MDSKARAQEQRGLPVGVCLHDRTDTVWSEGGKRLAEQCKGCAFVVGSYGTCGGCRSSTKLLTVRVESRSGDKPTFYCTADCLKAWRKEQKKMRDEAASLKAKPVLK